MASFQIGDLVQVGDAETGLDGIVFDTPSRLKAVVAVVDPTRGPVLRTVDVKRMAERAQDGQHDQALRALIRRTPPPAHGGARGGSSGQRGSAGFTRGAAHRPTGR